MNRRSFENHLFLDPKTFPTRETPIKNKKRRRVPDPVVRVLTPWSDASACTSKRARLALAAFLKHPAKLPPDPGSGRYPVAARFSLAAVGKGMALAKEPSRAAFIRRVLVWYYLPRVIQKQATPIAPKQPVAPVASHTSPSPIPAKKAIVPVPRRPAHGEARLRFDQVTPLFATYGYSFLPQSNCTYTLDSNGIIRQYDGNGKVMQTWEKPDFG